MWVDPEQETLSLRLLHVEKKLSEGMALNLVELVNSLLYGKLANRKMRASYETYYKSIHMIVDDF